jgi:hypothetical protein
VLALGFALTACITTGKADMFKDCRMTQETLATEEGPGYRLDVVGAPMLCVDPATAFDIWSHAGRLIVTNTGSQPFEIEHRAGATGGFSFRADAIADARNPLVSIGYESGPVAPASDRKVKVVIAPGESHKVGGDPRYMLQPVNLATTGQMIDGSPALAEERFDRTFRIEFRANILLNMGGKQVTVTETMPAILRIVVRDEANE